jgi:hypothetical protein
MRSTILHSISTSVVCATSLHLTGAALITKLIGSTNTFVPLRIAGISLVQLVWLFGSTSAAWHRVTYTVAPLLVT